MNLPILKHMQKVPGGLMIVPMLITAIINTIWPEALQIGGSTTGAFSTGTMTIIGIVLVISGSQLKLSQLVACLKRGGVLCLVKILLGFAAFFIVQAIWGIDGVAGMSLLALVIAFSSCNPGVYLALINDYGDTTDKTVLGLMSLVSVPALPLLILSTGQSGSGAIMGVIATLVPFLVGMLLGNLDDSFTKLLAPGTPICLIFLGCCFGSNINLINAVTAGPTALLLTVVYVVVSVPVLLITDRLILRRPGYAGVSMSSIAGIAVSCPMIIAAALPQYAPYVEVATSQLALAVVLTGFLVPYLTKFVADRFGSAKELAS